jgi:hypothetical protein
MKINYSLVSGHRKVRFRFGPFDSGSPRYRHRRCPHPKESKLSCMIFDTNFLYFQLLGMAGIEDCYTSAIGQTATLGNFAKATYYAIQRTYSYLTPDLWKENELKPTVLQ